MTAFPGDLSPFRPGFLRVQLFIGGAWVTVPAAELADDGVSIARSSAGGRLTFSIRDQTGKWSPRHPAGPYYGQIGRGTPVRVQVELTAGVVSDRFYGEVVTWQPRWTLTGPKDAAVDVECAGALRRLAQGASPLRSVLYRALSTLGADLVAYWPMEDGRDARLFSGAVGGQPLRIVSGTPSPANFEGFAASEAIPTLGNARLNARVPSYTTLSPNDLQVRWIGRIPAGTPNNAVILRVLASGTLAYAEVRYFSPNAVTIQGFNDSGVSVGTNTYAIEVDNKLCRFGLDMTQNGANIDWQFSMYEIGTPAAIPGNGVFTGVTISRASFVEVNPNGTNLGDLAFGHLTIERNVTPLFAVSANVLGGYRGEAADVRFNRLCAENGLTSTSSAGTTSQLMGAQGRDDLLTLLRECEATDGGQLYEPRSSTDLGFLTGESFYSQVPVTVPYVDNLLLPFEPVEDDRGTRNTVTVTRAGGASATVQETAGPLGTTVVGIYDESATLSLFTDDDAALQAAWRVHVGTHDEARWPTIGYDLADPRINTGLRNALLTTLGLGGRIDVTNLPPWLPPFPVSQIVRAYSERITPHSYRIELQCEPARPYRVPSYGAAGDRFSGEGTTAPALNATQTTFTVTLPPGGIGWVSSDGPYEIVIGGEVMRVTSVVGGTAFTVVRSVNGVVKTHLAGASVALADPVYYGL